MRRTLRLTLLVAAIAAFGSGFVAPATASAAHLMTCTFTGGGTFKTPVAQPPAVLQLTGYNFNTAAQGVDCALEIGFGISLNQKGSIISEGWYDAPVKCGLGSLFDKVGWIASNGSAPDNQPNTTTLTLPSGVYYMEYVTGALAPATPGSAAASLAITDFVSKSGTNQVGGAGEGAVVFTPKLAAGGTGTACLNAAAPQFDMTGWFTIEAL